jgi:hypothetical protein
MMGRFGLCNGQLERIRDVLPAREGPVGVAAPAIVRSSRPYSIVIVPGCHGAICPSVGSRRYDRFR